MEVNNMMDVLHYLFEEDVNFVSPEQMQSRTRIRQLVYKQVYDKVFEYGINEESDFSDSNEFGNAGDYVAQKPYENSEVKPYIPPTNFNPDAPNPFQGVLRENPLG